MKFLLFFYWLLVHTVKGVYVNNSLAFQVNAPPPSYGPALVTKQLISYQFANTYNQPPAQATYTPPNVEFNRVELTLNGIVFGNQFDRLNHIFLGDYQIWRASTPEPGGSPHKTWTFTKDVSEYVSLFKESSVISVVTGNVVDSTYTGIITLEISASFFYTKNDSWTPANHLIPVDPSDTLATTYSITSNWTSTLPQVSRNTTRAVLDVRGSGNSNEEFWYTNIFDKSVDKLGGPAEGYFGAGPSRIIRAYINGELAGFAYPFPIVYTGGISPSWWRTIVGIDAFEVPSYQIDVTPFLPDLWTGPTEISITVSNGYKEEAVNSDWLFNAHIFTWQEEGVTGSGYREPILIDFIQPSTWSNTDDYYYNQTVELVSGYESSATLNFLGNSTNATTSTIVIRWKQAATFSNNQQIGLINGTYNVAQFTEGSDISITTVNGQSNVERSRDYSYPFQFVAVLDKNGYGSEIIKRGLRSDTNDYQLSTVQIANNTFIDLNGTRSVIADTHQTLQFSGYGFDYTQDAEAHNLDLPYNYSSISPSGYGKRQSAPNTLDLQDLFSENNDTVAEILQSNLAEAKAQIDNISVQHANAVPVDELPRKGPKLGGKAQAS